MSTFGISDRLNVPDLYGAFCVAPLNTSRTLAIIITCNCALDPFANLFSCCIAERRFLAPVNWIENILVRGVPLLMEQDREKVVRIGVILMAFDPVDSVLVPLRVHHLIPDVD